MGASRVDLMREAIKSVVHLMRDAISDHPWPSRANQRSSEVISGHPRSSEVISVPGWRYATGSAES